MGYFSNGSESWDYEETYCNKCIHGQKLDDPKDFQPCAVLDAHSLYNYEECNNKKSILHILIPLKDGFNQKCRMFVEAEK